MGLIEGMEKMTKLAGPAIGTRCLSATCSVEEYSPREVTVGLWHLLKRLAFLSQTYLCSSFMTKVAFKYGPSTGTHTRFQLPPQTPEASLPSAVVLPEFLHHIHKCCCHCPCKNTKAGISLIFSSISFCAVEPW